MLLSRPFQASSCPGELVQVGWARCSSGRPVVPTCPFLQRLSEFAKLLLTGGTRGSAGAGARLPRASQHPGAGQGATRRRHGRVTSRQPGVIMSLPRGWYLACSSAHGSLRSWQG